MEFNHEEAIIVAHYEQFWNKPAATYTFNHDINDAPNPIRLLKFRPHSEDQDWVYASLGLSKRAMIRPSEWQGPSENHVEIFVYVREENDLLFSGLASVALYPFHKKTFISVGHVVPGEKGLIDDSPLTDILFTRPYGEPSEFEIVHGESEHIQMLWAIPIYRSEHLLVKQKGWKALETLFYSNKADTSDLYRLPLVK